MLQQPVLVGASQATWAKARRGGVLRTITRACVRYAARYVPDPIDSKE